MTAEVVQLSSEVPRSVPDARAGGPVRYLTRSEAYEPLYAPLRYSPRYEPLEPEARQLASPRCFRPEAGPILPLTLRQQRIWDRVLLPELFEYPVPPGCTRNDSEARKREVLLRLYQGFVVELCKGRHLMILKDGHHYSDIHCHIHEDLQTLQVDQGNDCIIEFPLSAVSKVYQRVKDDGPWHAAPKDPTTQNAEHVVVVEFMRRTLAFVFSDITSAQGFSLCLDLLIRRAQQQQIQEAEANNQKTPSC